MRTRVVTIFSLLLAAALMAACNGPALGGQPAASGPGGSATQTAGGPPADGTLGAQRQGGGFAGTPGAQRQGGGFAGTPGAQRQGGGFTGTPGAGRPGGGANGTPGARPTTDGTPQPFPTIARSAQVGTPPTAVPVPIIVIPTPVSGAEVSNNPAPTVVSAPSTAPTSQPAASPAAPTRAPAPNAQDLRGKIVFFSDRAGSYPQLYLMNADGSNPQLCSCSDLLPGLVANEVVSPDKQQFLFIKTVGSVRANDTQIWRHNNGDNTDNPVTGGPPGFPGVDYDPVWSPDSKHIAWVSEVNRFDEIYLYDATQNSNVRLTESSGEWYKHPSFSPDGSQLTFWSNRDNLNYKQIWVMNLDGSGKTNLSSNAFNDWDPIWVK